MGIEYSCDGCGKKQPARYNSKGDPLKPSGWSETYDFEFGPMHVCGTECKGLFEDESIKPSDLN